MFQQFLRIVSQGDVQSQYEIARKLKISPVMVLQIAQELTRTGYLVESGGACAQPGEPCAGCMTSSACQASFRQWSLTGKGEKAIDDHTGLKQAFAIH
jgi:hypothetical protein